DAFAILKGEDDAATQFLRRTTSEQLTSLFRPKVQESLNQVGATRYYADLVKAYNAIPSTKNINPDLNAYVTEKALDGLFTLIAHEEKNIRENPLERTTMLMRRVFAAQDRPFLHKDHIRYGVRPKSLGDQLQHFGFVHHQFLFDGCRAYLHIQLLIFHEKLRGTLGHRISHYFPP